MTLLLFDIDMTLISTGGAGIRALDRAFSRLFGLSHALDGVRPHGKTDPAIIREACENQGLDGGPRTQARILDLYAEFLEAEVAESETYQVLPGVEALLEDCRDSPGIVVGLATGNVETGARIKLGRGGLNPYFSFGGFGSDSENRTEVVRTAARRGEAWKGGKIPPADTYVIGDTPMDIAAGREAGFVTIGVATGSYSGKDLLEAGADLVIADFLRGRDQFPCSTRMR
jgi:phosphoglycolate phosphatase-like HAD superfamily hydrolase